MQAGTVFSPSAPIDEKRLFAGREAQVRRVVDAINQRGQHAVLFGERGVGKTSLANVLPQFLWTAGKPILAPRVNCSASDGFDAVWQKWFDQVDLAGAPTIGFGAAPREHRRGTTLLASPLTPDTVRRALGALAQSCSPIVIVDEFDRLRPAARRAFADTIKDLSDHAVPATLLIVGVADSVDDLIREHQSVERAMVQVQMPRMSTAEIEQILDTGARRLGMTASDEARRRVSALARGLPHYAHLIGLHSARAALDDRSLEIRRPDVERAIARALENAQQSIRSAYHDAVHSARADNLFEPVLLACALAEANELGFFAAQDVRRPMAEITGRDCDVSTFTRHLNEFSSPKRGGVLQKVGEKRRYRYRFANPLMQPFVIMQGARRAARAPAG